MADLDKLQIELEAESKKADSAIDSLIEKLSGLKQALEFDIGDSGITSFTKSVGELSETIQKIDTARLDGVVKGVEKITAAEKDLRGFNAALEESASDAAKTAAEVERLGTTKAPSMSTDMAESLARTSEEIEHIISQLQIASVSAEELKAVLDSNFFSDTFRSAVYDLQEAQKQYEEIKLQMSEMSVEAEKLHAAIDNATNSKELSAATQALDEHIQKFEETSRQADKTASAVDRYGNKILKMQTLGTDKNAYFRELEKEAKAAGVSVDYLDKKTKKMLANARSAGSGIKAAFSGMGSGVSSLQSPLAMLEKSISRAFAKFITLPRLVSISLLRRAINQVVKDIGTAMQSLAQFSGLVGQRFNASMSSIVTNAKWVGANIVAAFAPLVNAVAPIIDFIAEKIVALITVINMLFARLTGASTYAVARKQMVSYGASVGSAGKAIKDSVKPTKDIAKNTDKAAKAAKKLRDFSLGIDELNVISPEEDDAMDGLDDYIGDLEDLNDALDDLGSGDGGGGGGLGYVWDEMAVPDWLKDKDLFELGRWISDSLSEALESIDWDSIYEKARAFGTGLAEFLNGLITPRLFYNLGRTLANALNTVIYSALSFAETFDWSNFGLSLAAGVNGFFQNFDFESLAQTINRWVQGIAKTVKTFFANVEWKDILNGLTTFFKTLEPETYALLITAWLSKALFKGVTQALAKVSISGMISGHIASALGSLPAKVSAAASGFGTKIMSAIAGGLSTGNFAASFSSVFGTIATTISGIAGVLGGAALAIKSFFDMWTGGWSVLGEILKDIGIAVAAVGAVLLGAAAAPAALVAGIVAAVSTAAIVIHDNWDAIVNFFSNTVPAWWEGTALPFIQSIPERVAEFASRVVENVKTFFGQIPGKIAETVAPVKEAVGNVINAIGEWFSQLPYKIGYALGSALGSIVKWGADVFSFLTTNVPIWIENVTTWFSQLPGKIWQWLSDVIAKITQWGAEVISWITTNVPQMTTNIVNFFMELPGKIWNEIIKVVEKFSEWGENLISWITTNVPVIIDELVGFFLSLPEKFIEIGGNIINGLWEGITSTWESVKQGVSDLCDGFIQGFKDKLGIHSPSTIAEGIGGDWIGGLMLPFSNGNILEPIRSFTTSFANIFKTSMSTLWNGINTDTNQKWQGISTTLNQSMQNIQKGAGNTFPNVQKQVGTSWQSTQTDTNQKWNSISSSLTQIWRNLNSNASTQFQSMQRSISNVNQSIQTDTNQKWTTIERTITQTLRNIQSAVSTAMNAIRRDVETSMNAVKTAVETAAEMINKLKDAFVALKDALPGVKSGLDNVRTSIDALNAPIGTFNSTLSTTEANLSRVVTSLQNAGQAVDAFRSKFDAELKFKVKIPVFAMNGKFDAENGTVPTVYIARWDTFQQGGFPEDGFFFANSTELVGRFNNGKTAVANNEQIIAGIERGVYSAMMRANGGGDREVALLEKILDATRQGKIVSIDGRELVSSIEGRQRRNGWSFQPA